MFPYFFILTSAYKIFQIPYRVKYASIFLYSNKYTNVPLRILTLPHIRALFYIRVCPRSEFEDTTRVFRAFVPIIEHPLAMLDDKPLSLFLHRNRLRDLLSRDKKLHIIRIRLCI